MGVVHEAGRALLPFLCSRFCLTSLFFMDPLRSSLSLSLPRSLFHSFLSYSLLNKIILSFLCLCLCFALFRFTASFMHNAHPSFRFHRFHHMAHSPPFQHSYAFP